MALFSMRDSWNVWRRKVNEAIGTVEPIDSKDVIYDNASSGLTATNVQGAIDEVASSIASIPDGYALMGTTLIQDVLENKTYSECLDTIATHLLSDVQALADDEIIIPIAITIVGNAFMNTRFAVYNNASTDVVLVASTVSLGVGIGLLWSGIANSTSTASTLFHMEYTNNAWTLINDSSNSAGASRTVQCYYYKFKKLK